MGSAWCDCWKCDLCGHKWIKTELVPIQCSKCRSRKWDGRIAQRTEQQVSTLSVAGSSPAPATKPTMADLPAICAGNVPAAVIEPQEERPMCSYKEWYEGEQWQCGLPEHSPKTKHTKGYQVA